MDSAGSAYVAGITESVDFPVRNAFQIHLYGISDAYVAKFSPDGSTLVYSTYLGGQSADEAWGIAVDQDGRAYLTGTTGSADFPTKLPVRPELGGNYDVFVTRFSPDGSRLEYSTYLGGAGYERALGIALDGAGNVYLTGHTESLDFPTMNPLQPDLRGGQDAFVTKVSP